MVRKAQPSDVRIEQFRLFWAETLMYWKILPLWQKTIFVLGVLLNIVTLWGLARGW